MNVEEERKKFEAWFHEKYRYGLDLSIMASAWESWQAAKADKSDEHDDALTVAYLSGAADARKKMEREPLTNEKILSIFASQFGMTKGEYLINVGRAIEAELGVGP